MWYNRWDLTIIRNEVEEVNKGNFPLTLVPPDIKKNVLRKISHPIPDGFVLPMSAQRNINWFYKHLKTIYFCLERCIFM